MTELKMKEMIIGQWTSKKRKKIKNTNTRDFNGKDNDEVVRKERTVKKGKHKLW